MTSRPWAPLIWFGVVFVGGGAAFLATGIHGLAVQSSLHGGHASGFEQVTGTVIRKSASAADGLTGHRTYSIDFRYVTPDGATIQSHAMLTKDAWDALTELGPVPVRYLRAHPERRLITGEPNDGPMWWIFAGLGGLFCSIGLLVEVFVLRKLVRRRHSTAGAG